MRRRPPGLRRSAWTTVGLRRQRAIPSRAECDAGAAEPVGEHEGERGTDEDPAATSLG